uniref:Uncharacterized protein n=1 Tax=Megaselia scalaris TaxID=36166 RepID=T1H360_MEGSC
MDLFLMGRKILSKQSCIKTVSLYSWSLYPVCSFCIPMTSVSHIHTTPAHYFHTISALISIGRMVIIGTICALIRLLSESMLALSKTIRPGCIYEV